MKPGMLSSDILEQQFGPTGLVVLRQEGASRITCTRSTATGQILELSQVQFIPAGAKKYAGVHAVVMGGTSMGKAFRGAGVAFTRQQHSAARQVLPSGLQRWLQSAGAATVVSVSVLAGSDKTPYANILEIYHPQVVWPLQEGTLPASQRGLIHALDAWLAGRDPAQLAVETGNRSFGSDI